MSLLPMSAPPSSRWRCQWQALRVAAGLVAAGLALGACSTAPLAVQQAQALAREGRHADAWTLLKQASTAAPADEGLRAAEVRERERAISQWVLAAQGAAAGGQPDTARRLLAQAEAADAQHPRVVALRSLLARPANASVASPAAEARTAATAAVAAVTAPAGNPVSLDFRDAPLRSVFDTLARSQQLNFVFDRDVRGDARITLALRATPLPEALRILLATQSLAAKPLNDRTWFIYPDNAAKQREHRELVVRSFYLANADARQAQALLRSLAKIRELHVDERLNLIVVRDTPEGVALAQQLLASIDLPEPEVVLDVEVLEIASSRLVELGVQWPDQVAFGLPGTGGAGAPATALLGQRREFAASIANPALLATLRETLSQSDTLANPRLRARNREKARVLVGEKLPVFTTTATAGVGSSSTVTYLDVGLKLEVEPQVQLEGDVTIKIALEVSTLIGRVAGPQGAIGYQVGTREASTSLRLRDGETQILAGLIRDEDSRGSVGLPGLVGLPVLGRLFGRHDDQRRKTEIVLLITPRIVRSVVPPAEALADRSAGSEAQPGQAPWRLASNAQAAMAMTSGVGSASGSPGGGMRGNTGTGLPAIAKAETTAARAVQLRLAASGEARVGSVVAVTLDNPSDASVEGELSFDPRVLQAAQAGAGPSLASGRAPFKLGPGAQFVLPLRVLASGAGQTLEVSLDGVIARDGRGDALEAISGGSVAIQVAPSASPTTTALPGAARP